jgi:hypothetical protein
MNDLNEETFLYLITTGHKSGVPHEIEIWHVAHDSAQYMVAEQGDRAHWVQNIRQQPAVQFKVATRDAREITSWVAGHARLLDPVTEPELAAAVRALMDARYSWSDGLIVEVRASEP